jgi:uncharacterized protein YcbX
MHVSGLFVYPVKSLRGFAVSAAQLDILGFVGDRRFLVVDPSGRQLTQRVLPKMARVATALSADALTLTTDESGSISIPRAVPAKSAPIKLVSVWKSEGLRAEDCGDEPAAFLSDFLETPCRLVRIGAEFHRPILKKAAVAGDVVSFADSVPFLVITEASLSDLNDRIVATGEDAVPMNRFRPNIVVAGSAPFAEDAWPRVRMGAVALRAAGTCVRCIMPTIDQETAEGGKEPLRTLATYRRDPNDSTGVIFGQNFIHETKRGVIRVGEEVVPQ